MATNNNLAVLTTDSGGGIGLSNPLGVSVPAIPDASVRPFDISETALRGAEAKGNKRQDVLTAYESYLTNTVVGKGGQYAASAQQKYGYASIRDAASSYLQTAGLGFLADIVSPTPTPPTIPTTPSTPDTPITPSTPTTPQNPFELLLDALPSFFGQSTYNPPLQSQTYGYTPEQTLDSGGGGISLKPILILVALAAIGYFLYKRYA